MTKKFTLEEVTKIAQLSSLELTNNETKIFAEQFSTILEYFKLLKEIEIADVNCDGDENHLNNGREDKVIKSNVSPGQFSPYTEKGFFKVPKIIDPDR